MLSQSYIFDIKSNVDSRGILSSIEGLKDIPIEVKRVFYIHHINTDRGGHAHIDTDQVVIAIAGSFKIKLFDGAGEIEYLMNDCMKGLYIPRLIFTDLYGFSPDAVGLVLANTYYDMNKSLRTRNDYINYIEGI